MRVLLLILVFLPSLALSSNADDSLLEEEVGGLIIDRTVTRLGEDFYFFFSQLMNEQHESLQENFTVKERPTALSGSIIAVSHRQRVLYRTALSPGRRQAQDKAKEALGVMNSYLVRWEAERAFMDTFDLERDEF
ncbi:curli production assembly/transport protein CsgE [Vibrio mexicanus]|uniref:curli production assembly/transport protein CsgE n=1 Tax=Vibrio mexicanus TaxID=1004326 RepID=UPI00063CBFF9|nr:curli production assembly/transport protein CsgE [Vibrio mexicanus]